VAAELGDPDAVVARLSTAAARLKTLQAQAADAVAALELPAFDEVQVTAATLRPPAPGDARTDAALARLHAATAALDPMRAELTSLRAQMDAVATELRLR
jgi:hypothetical protein